VRNEATSTELLGRNPGTSLDRSPLNKGSSAAGAGAQEQPRAGAPERSSPPREKLRALDTAVLAGLSLPIWVLDVSGYAASAGMQGRESSGGSDALERDFLNGTVALYANDAAVDFHKAADAAELLGRLDQIFGADAARAVANVLDGSRKLSQRDDLALRTLDGKTRRVRAQLDLIAYDTAAPCVVLMLLPDAPTSNLLHIIPDLAFELDANGIYVDFAGPEEDAFLAPGEFLGKSVTETMPPDVAHRTLAALQRLREHGGRERFEYALSMSDGLHWYEARMNALPGGGATAYVRDVTEQKSAEWRYQESEQRFRALDANVRARTQELEIANQELEAFSYSVAHDLRAPLRAISGFTQTILDRLESGLDERNLEYIERICASARHMDQLIADLLRLARVSRAEVAHDAVDLSALAVEVAARLQNSDPTRRTCITVQPSIQVRGDAGLLRIVLENLLGNAWKFTAATEESSIEVGAFQEDHMAVCYVRDNGAGFDMQHADRLFSAFQRLHSPQEFEGTGIGLAMTHRIIQRHRGRIWAEAQPGKGATFYFALAK
jgi:signal transduction histidine kinase